MITVSRLLLVGLLSSFLAGCGPDPQVESCIKRGVAYFKEIGSYPTLTTAPSVGREAEDVARERCRRTPTAF